MIQFNAAECDRIIKGLVKLQEQTGSEYMWDEYETLAEKVKCYREQVTTD